GRVSARGAGGESPRRIESLSKVGTGLPRRWVAFSESERKGAFTTSERVPHRRASLFAGLLIHLGHVLPIDQMIHEGLEIVGPAIAVVDVVGMLPDVAAEDRLASVHQRVLAIGGLHCEELFGRHGEAPP